MSRLNSNRVRNILAGDYTAKTQISVGFVPEDVEHKEGDIWEEGGKSWTIKDGIKRTVSVLSNVRHIARPPLTCPECGTLMKKRLDKKMWTIREKCFGCVVEEDTKKMITGEYKHYEKDVITGNMKSYLDHVQEMFNDYVDKSDSKHYVTEVGDVEDWQNQEYRRYGRYDLIEASLKKGQEVEDYAGATYTVIEFGKFAQVKKYDSTGAGSEAFRMFGNTRVWVAVKDKKGETFVFTHGDDGVE